MFIPKQKDFCFILTSEYLYTCIYPTPPHEQDATQGQFLSSLADFNSKFSFS